ncbi:MAG: OmpH family outer membrane protein [Bacteroidales bacterium]|nr:OmpH family outer membrane protein [Bacteroidales bacterium]
MDTNTSDNIGEAQQQNLISEVKENKNGASKGLLGFLLASNIILLIAVVILFVLFFKNGETDGKVAASDTQSEILGNSSNNIAFIRSDSLMEKYELAIRMRADLESKQKRMEAEFNQKQSSFQKEAESFQKSVNAGTISIDQAQIKEKELMQKQQELIDLNQTLSGSLAKQEYDLNIELLDSISGFLERYNKEFGFDFILGYSPGGGILYASDKKDITTDVIKKMNESYLKGKDE